jgi:hypothetical protein
VAEVEAPLEDAAVLMWRRLRFLELGFSLRESRILAEQGADWHEAELLIVAGCKPKHAFRLLR